MPQDRDVLVSVGIPTYNRPEGLDRTLRQITAQTWRNLEIIVSDNASPGLSVLHVLKKWADADARVRVIRQERNIGSHANFQHVLSVASGRLFMWAADDDEWHPEFVERCVPHALGGHSVMPSFEVLNRATGDRTLATLPELTGQDRVRDLHAFFRNMQPNIIYGLHVRETMTRLFRPDRFDFGDCALVSKLILEAGVKTLPGAPLYTVGIDDQAYVIKYADAARGRLDFGPFLHKIAGVLLRGNGLPVRQRLELARSLLETVFGLMRHHEKTAHPARRAAAEFLAAWRLPVEAPVVDTAAAPEPDRISYAQSGEDLIIDFILRAMRISWPTYLDIGAHHPTYLSNTHFLYVRGGRGVNVEPDPDLFGAFTELRPADTNVNCAISMDEDGEADFYRMSASTLNTLSADEARAYEASGHHRIQSVVRVPTLTIGTLMERYFPSRPPDVLSVDIEGLDEQVIRSLDLARHRPVVICVETLTYSVDRKGRKLQGIGNHLTAHGYWLYADTQINSIFVDANKWPAPQ